jgi:hypothetical protein
MCMTQQAFGFWRAYTAQRRQQGYALEQLVVRRSHRLLVAGWAAWCQRVADARVQRHRIAVCQRRRHMGTLRAVLAAWRWQVEERRAEEQLVQRGLKRSNRSR